jgi:hypothetical protein
MFSLTKTITRANPKPIIETKKEVINGQQVNVKVYGEIERITKKNKTSRDNALLALNKLFNK